MALNELGWIFAELTVQNWMHFHKIWLDLGGCNRFEWIWLSLGGLELVRPDSGAKVVCLDGLGPIAQNGTKTSNLEPLNDTLRGFAALQACKRHLPKAMGLPGVSKRHPPRIFGPSGGPSARHSPRMGPPGFFQRHPPRGSCQNFKGVQSEPNLS